MYRILFVLQETLEYVFKEISSLWQTFGQKPIFGVECDIQPDKQLASLASMRISEKCVGAARRQFIRGPARHALCIVPLVPLAPWVPWLAQRH